MKRKKVFGKILDEAYLVLKVDIGSMIFNQADDDFHFPIQRCYVSSRPFFLRYMGRISKNK